MIGTIVTLKISKFFGFIAPDEDLGSDLFFFSTSVSNRQFSELHIGDAVEFTLEQHEKGLRARDITVL